METKLPKKDSSPKKRKRRVKDGPVIEPEDLKEMAGYPRFHFKYASIGFKNIRTDGEITKGELWDYHKDAVRYFMKQNKDNMICTYKEFCSFDNSSNFMQPSSRSQFNNMQFRKLLAKMGLLKRYEKWCKKYPSED